MISGGDSWLDGIFSCHGNLTLREEAAELILVPVRLIALDVFSPRAFTLSFSLKRRC